jgi:ABC-type multidrug transport system fused ATPase/permease subunit
MFGKNISNILKDFYYKNQNIIHTDVIGFIALLYVEMIMLPKTSAKLFIGINDKEKLKNNIYKVIMMWALYQGAYAVSDTLHSKIEPKLTKYFTDLIIKNIFIKYQNTFREIDTTIVFSKISLIRHNLESLIEKFFLMIVPRVIASYIAIFNFYKINKKLGITSFICVSIQLFIIFSNIQKCVNASYDEIESKDNIMNYIEDKFDNIHIISSVANGIDNEVKNCMKQSEIVMDKMNKLNNCTLDRQNYGYFTNTIVFIVILLILYDLYEKKEISSEELVTVTSMLFPLFNQICELTYQFPDVISKLGVLNKNKEFIDELFSHEIKKGNEFELNKSIIEFKNVTFSYGKNKIFSDFNKKIGNENKNSIIGIYGKSGSGKSTFIKLICNILSPDSGNIYLDGHDINDISYNCLRKYILYNSQNTSTLFNTTIYKNIAYGNNHVGEDELKEKIKNIIDKYNLDGVFANINKEVSIIQKKQIDKYDFLNYDVGKNAELLSGGQKQVIHIIRSILNTTAIIFIYDEPTSAVDNINKNKIMNMINDKIKDTSNNKLSLIITHDNGIQKYFDEIIYIGKY